MPRPSNWQTSTNTTRATVNPPVAGMASGSRIFLRTNSARVRKRSAGEGGEEVLIADMEVGYKAIHEKFASRVTLDRAERKVLVEYVDGPFRHLENTWNFIDEEAGASRIEFFISYEFRSRLLGALMGSMFDTAFRRFAQAFEARADVVYGKG